VPVYLDHNATSPASPEHLAEVFANLQKFAGNPSSPHAVGRAASVALMDARKQLASSVSVEPSEIVFLSGGSEANNLATTGVLTAIDNQLCNLHAITSAVEHPCILEPLKFLHERHGLQLTVLPVDSEGRISLADLVSSIRTQTVLVTVMVANNETGAVQPVREFADWLNMVRWSKPRPGHDWRESQQTSWPDWALNLDSNVTQQLLQSLHFHVDAVQAYGKIPTGNWWSQGYDSASVCAHKIGGLSGIGALVLRRGRKFQPLVRGGAQERSRRAGTENLTGILSFGLIAQKLQKQSWWDDVNAMAQRKLKLLDGLSSLSGIVLSTPKEGCLPNTVNFSVDGKIRRGEDVLLELDMRGFYASSGSACSSSANRPSHVLLAQWSDAEIARNAIRISLSAETTDADIEGLLGALAEIFKSR
jgi:cysteine desulfurase